MSEEDSNDEPLKDMKSEIDNKIIQTKANYYNKKYLNIYYDIYLMKLPKILLNKS